MDHKTMGNVHNGVLLSHKEVQHHVIYREMDGTGEYYVSEVVSKNKKLNAQPMVLKILE